MDGLLTLRFTQFTSSGQTYAILFKGATPDTAHLITEGYLPGEGEFSPPEPIHVVAGQEYTISLGNTNYPGSFTLALQLVPDPSFFDGEVSLSNGVRYLSFSGGNYFGYYSYLSDPHYIYHFDLGYEYVFTAGDGKGGVYFYDFASQTFFYTSPGFAFPYLYDFTLKTVLYYYPDTGSAGHYTANPRYFYNFATQQIITK